jgi:hypothetical protein
VNMPAVSGMEGTCRIRSCNTKSCSRTTTPRSSRVSCAAGAVLRASGLLGTGIALGVLGLLTLLTVAIAFLSRFPSREGIGVGDNGVLVRSRSRPDQWVPWSEVERFEVVSQGRADAISVIRGNAEPLLAGRFYRRPLTRARNVPAIKAYKAQHALEHEPDFYHYLAVSRASTY